MKEKDLCILFEKGLKTLRAYRKSSNLFKKCLEEIKEEIEKNFTEPVLLKLNDLYVEQNETVMYKKVKKEENIFFPLYRDGLREILIDPKIDLDEIEGFLEVLNFDITKSQEEIDTVGFLWLKDLRSISYKAVDGIGEKGEEGGQGNELFSAVEKIMSDLKENIMPYKEIDSKYKMVIDRDIRIDKLYVQDKEKEKVPFDENPLIFAISEEEIEKIKKEVISLDEDEQKIIFKFMKVLLFLSNNKELAENIQFYFEKLAISFIELKDFKGLLYLLKELENLKEKKFFFNLVNLLNIDVLKEIINYNLKEEEFEYLSFLLLKYLPERLIELFSFLPTNFSTKFRENIKKAIKEDVAIIENYKDEEIKKAFILDFLEPDVLFIYLDNFRELLNSKRQDIKEKAFSVFLKYGKYIGFNNFLSFLKEPNAEMKIRLLKTFEEEDLSAYIKFFLDFFDYKIFHNLSFTEKKLYIKLVLKNGNEMEKNYINNLIPKKRIFISKNEKKKAMEVAKILSQIEEGKIFLQKNEKLWKKYFKE